MALTKKPRNYGIDLLRIVSMFMIVMLHTLGHGSAIKGADPMSVHYKLLWIFECASYCAVNCFALVSGYVGLNSRFKLSGIVQLWLQVVFYHAVFTIVWALVENRPVDLAAALMPVKNNAYWYYTAYFGISFFTPLVNKAVENLDRKTALLCAVGAVLLFSVYPTLAGVDIFGIDGGYHVLWLLVIYLLGAVIRRHAPLEKWGKGAWALVYLAMVALSWGTKVILDTGRLIQYTSPTILLAAVALLMLFSRIPTAGRVQKWIALVSPLTFGVYLIHDSLFIRNTFIKGSLSAVSAASVPVMLGRVLCFACAVFVCCLVIEWLRSQLFKVLHVKELVDKIMPK